MAARCTLSTVFLLLTLTRGALIGTVVGVVLVAVIQKRRKRSCSGSSSRPSARWRWCPGSAVRPASVDTQRAVGGPPTSNTPAVAARLLDRDPAAGQPNPVTGIGLDMTQYKTDAAKQPHNDFIRAYVETGCSVCSPTSRCSGSCSAPESRPCARTRPGHRDRGIAAGFLGCAVAFVLQSLAANVISNVVSLWYLVAFAAAASFVARQKSSLSNPTVPASAPAAKH